MCSNTSSSCGGDLECATSGSRKQKRQRIPRRGPGVAELEKILREQENRDDMDKGVMGAFLSSPTSLPKKFSFPQDHKNFGPPLPPAVTGLLGTGAGDVNVNVNVSGDRNSSSQLGGVHTGGSGRISPENHLSTPPLPRMSTHFRSGGGGVNLNSNGNGNSKLVGDGSSGGNGGSRPMVLPCGSGDNGGGRGHDRGRSANTENHHFSPPFPPVYSMGNGSKGVFMGGSGTVLPVKLFMPTTPTNRDSDERKVDMDCRKMVSDLPFPAHFLDHNQMFPTSPRLPKKPSTMNLFPNPPLSSSSSSSSTGLYQHHVEPPSNQRSYQNYTAQSPEEDIKIAGTKRPRPFPTVSENPPSAAPSPFCAQHPSLPTLMHRLDPSYLVGNHGGFNLGTTSASRDRIQSSILELTMTKGMADYATNGGNNGIMFGSPTTPSQSVQTCQQELFKVQPFPSQELMKERCETSWACQRSIADGSGQRKPFYCFLQPEEEMEAADTRLSLHERCETREDEIDLDLKL
ncbi:hypothetical protein SLEP1_g44894 [Rubroshorea leprosula]|uniref:Uncharacterized protein n=1 Tax=Rubroshorea leprosula TaxID=152421 RepID=A0AAV5LJB9_9ROSI|nr:hypothetical protein SLEP1_g44894 [Rubroshorea leprosula]